MTTYTNRDQETIKQELLQKIKTRFPNDFGEFIKTSPAMNILDIIAYNHAQRAFYYDMQARNGFLLTSVLEEAGFLHAKALGYTPRLASPASISVSLFPSPPQPVPITIVKGTQVEVGDLKFEAASTYTIPASIPEYPAQPTDPLVIFTEGETRSETFISSGISAQKFNLSIPNVIKGSVVVSIANELWEETSSLLFSEANGRARDAFIGTGTNNQKYKLSKLNPVTESQNSLHPIVLINGEAWAQVDFFSGAPKEYIISKDENGVATLFFGTSSTGSSPASNVTIDAIYFVSGAQKRYTTTVSSNGRVTVNFGDGLNALVPALNETISVSYRVGGGVRGNLPRGAIDTVIRGNLPGDAQINVRVFNKQAGSGGENAETLEQIKFRAPLYAKSNEKAVTLEDFSILASTYSDPIYGSPAFASAKLKNLTPEENTVQIAIWARDALGRLSVASSALKLAVKSYLDAVRTANTVVEIIDGQVLFFTIEADVELDRGKLLSSVSEVVSKNLQEFFNSTFVFPGVDLSPLRIAKVIEESDGISLVDMRVVSGSYLVSYDFGIGNGTTKTFSYHFLIPDGLTLVPNSVVLSDGIQKLSDNGTGLLLGDADPTLTNSVDYVSGLITGSFFTAPLATRFILLEARIKAYMAQKEEQELQENKLNFLAAFAPIVSRQFQGIGDGISIQVQLPQEFIPYTPHRILFIGGYDFDGTNTGGQILAYDDGNGNIIGNVVPGGTINYDTGLVIFNWNTIPSPVSTTNFFGRLVEVPDGTRTSFTLHVRTATGGGGSLVNLSALNCRGRLKLDLSALSSINLAVQNGYDNAFGIINSPSLDKRKTNTIDYATGIGTLTFVQPLPTGTNQNFTFSIAPTTLFLYAPFCAFIESVGGYEKIIFADHRGKFIGNIDEVFPSASLDYFSGRAKGNLTLNSSVGKRMTFSYDSFVASRAKNLQISSSIASTFASVKLYEMARQV